ncbi:haloacid dehalogenase-like hydrolase [Lactobacillus sp. ESL0791]|uniref:DUF7916 family protein n=1 Tax=Lactobacillus sp. ESL0791 TaxID=2983234 RepID=UPI0023F77B61|nr:haloacid dehalogenase-like hydrolase [Lactobacillus sp. ESL0791]MDF7638314.1 haloacid dehalogenase-like hydrolase [Lactobacillus sp. ESL0791]
MKRLLDLAGQDFINLSKIELKQAILASEGRVICAENVPTSQPYLGATVSNAEIEKAAGADLLLFNAFDIFNPKIQGIPQAEKIQTHPIQWLKKALCRPMGLNLEPIDNQASMLESRFEIPLGRRLSVETLKQAEKLGFDFICLTGNPATGVSNKSILASIKLCKENYNGLIFAGKMHGAGISEEIMNLDIAKQFVKAGVDVLLVPAPYTVPGFMVEDLREIVRWIRNYNQGKTIEEKVLVMAANGTSQDSSDPLTIKKIALTAKECGVDIQHIGDSMTGIALPQNIYALGEAIRGYRHQITMMSRSNYRGVEYDGEEK